MLDINYIAGHAQLKLDRRGRSDALTAQTIDVAIIFQEMLGTAAAAEYLRGNGVPLSVALRVLVHARRKDPSPPKMIGIVEGHLNCRPSGTIPE
jgi:hypothetical protein